MEQKLKWTNQKQQIVSTFMHQACPRYKCYVQMLLTYWASSTGLPAVSTFKPRLPAQWAVGTHCKGPSRMEKSNFQNELTKQKYVSNSHSNLAYRQHHNVNAMILFHFQ